MKYLILLFVFAFIASCDSKQPVIEWVSTTPDSQWVRRDGISLSSDATDFDAKIQLDKKLQTIEGFGACFNEMGWASLSLLPEEDQSEIFRELYEPGIGANFTVCRMPVAANDFSIDWYSYNETEGDFEMKNFSINNDLNTLVPFIKKAQQYNSDLKLWASPWSPPSWMKYNKHYASVSSLRAVEMAREFIEQRKKEGSEGEGTFGSFFDNIMNPNYQNDLPFDRQGQEGTDMFIQDEKYLKAYALYFQKFIDAYDEQGIDISMVMPQNEFNSAQVFPSCCWTAKGLANFIGSYLGPAMKEKGVEIYFGTMERPTEALVDTILTDPKSSQYVGGVGFQWAGKDALPGINKKYPELAMYQTEQECGDGKNDWEGAEHSWDLMKHYLRNGVSVYEYWNTSLLEGGISRWGWAQNSLVVVDTKEKDYRFSYEYYLLKHLSHYVLPGAKMLETSGDFDDLLAFENTDSSIVVMAYNESDQEKNIKLEISGKLLKATLEAKSFNTIKVK